MKKRVVLLLTALVAACIVGGCSINTELHSTYDEKLDSTKREESAEESTWEQASEALDMVEDFYDYDQKER